MSKQEKCRSRRFAIDVWAILAAGVVATLTIILAANVEAQTYSVLYNFSAADGNTPTAPLLVDRSGRLSGTMQYGQYGNCNYTGSAFQLKPTGAGWVLNPIHCFDAPLGGDDGAFPINHGGLTVGPDGAFYGTTEEGGINNGTSSMGVVFRLAPPARACVTALCPWTATVLYKFTNSPDGAYPHGNVSFDAAGNLYGTTAEGGRSDGGTIFKLARSGSGWTESVIFSFRCCVFPEAGVIADSAGNLYGVDGTNVFQLSPSGSGWNFNVLHTFTGSDGLGPVGGLIFDQAGNLYGSTTHGGPMGNGGTVFQLSPSGGTWTLNTLCSFAGSGGPQDRLTMDAAGDLYGVTLVDGRYSGGSIFKVSYSDGSWTCTDLHDFQQDGQGVFPVGGVTLDANGNLYGMTTQGGTFGDGIVWEITQ